MVSRRDGQLFQLPMSVRPGKSASAAPQANSTALPHVYPSSSQEQQPQQLHDAATSSSFKLDMAASDADERINDYRAGSSIKPLWATLEQCPTDLAIAFAIFLLAAVLRFWNISHPQQVVFDEVHFGKFASYYLRRQYFFDVHPPFAKLLYAFQGWLIGYDGHFDFDNIGDDYIKNRVPYIGLRTLPALLGSLTPAVVFGIMKETGHPPAVSVFSALLVALDNAHIAQTRLILLDAPCLFFMVCSIYAYVRFYKLRYNEFSKPWWGWMMATGTFLALTVSSKINGLFTPLMIGAAVVIDLWNILDIRRQIPMNHVIRHFMARVYGLILLPAGVYLFWFWVHFAVLTKSGTGDDFMSPAFQETLQDSAIMLSSQEVYYHDIITLHHKHTKAYLHSHPERYPLKYDDGRISSQGQQVTAYAFEDSNNDWQILPTRELSDDPKDRIVRSKDVIRLLHINTNTTLLTHDVASPLMATNTEFTTVDPEDEARYEETKFRIEFQSGKEGKKLKSKKSLFKLIHLDTNVALWTHADPVLPEWGASQQEVNGNKNTLDKTNMWSVDSIRVLEGEGGDPLRPELLTPEPKPPKKRNFFLKFLELQTLMFQHNAGLTDSHPYASGPVNWPFLLSGISFWTGKQEDRQQIYLIGNIAGWWVSSASLAILAGVMMADAVARRRGFYPIPEVQSNRLWNTTMFFVMGWAVHYFPHYLMNRQLFLHHYMPSHILSTMVAGSMVHFIITETINSPVSIPGPFLKTRLRRRSYAEQPLALFVVIAVILLLVLIALAFLKPLTYGTPGLTPSQVNRRRILSTWTLHFAK